MFQGMEYVYEVYKEKSFSKAAANLFISQPSLSANVRRVHSRHSIRFRSSAWKRQKALTKTLAHGVLSLDLLLPV